MGLSFECFGFTRVVDRACCMFTTMLQEQSMPHLRPQPPRAHWHAQLVHTGLANPPKTHATNPTSPPPALAARPHAHRHLQTPAVFPLTPPSSIQVLICPDKRRPEENKEKVLLAYTAQVDAWAVGILAYELLVGYPPFEQESRAATYQHIMYKEPKFPAWMTEDAKKFITQALCKVRCSEEGGVREGAMGWGGWG